MKSKVKTQFKQPAVNDNYKGKSDIKFSASLYNLTHEPIKKAKASQATNSQTWFGAQNHRNEDPIISQSPKLQVIFLIILGFTLTSLATLSYVYVTSQYASLLPVIIPAVVLGGLCLIAMRSHAALWVSLAAVFIWGVLAAVAQYNGQIIPAYQWSLALPILLTLQIAVAHQSKLRAIMIASLSCAYLWLAIFTLGSNLSALASGSLFFILGTAHHRLGKSLGDKDINYAHEHTIFGWVAAMLGLMWTQHYFIPFGGFEANASGTLAHQSNYWVIGTAIGLIVIAISSLQRIKHNRLTKFGFLAIFTGCLILPIIAYSPVTMSVFEHVASLPATPYLGFSLGAIIIALAAGTVMNGLRRRQFIDAIIGSLVIFAQLAIIFNPSYFSFDTFIVVIIAMMLALCFELIISRHSIMTTPIAHGLQY